MKAVAVSTVGVAGSAALTSLAGVNWGETIADAPGPDFAKVAAVGLIVGAINFAVGWWKREFRVSPDAQPVEVDVPPVE